MYTCFYNRFEPFEFIMDRLGAALIGADSKMMNDNHVSKEVSCTGIFQRIQERRPDGTLREVNLSINSS